jgi:lipopolysaccharide/colanic/teichoic acid biosynthesis glycosyltransferase
VSPPATTSDCEVIATFVDAPTRHRPFISDAVFGSGFAELDVVPDFTDAAVAAEVDALDELWTKSWSVDEERAYGVQAIELPALPENGRHAELAQRALDVFVSVVALVALLPLMLLLAIGVKATSSGPALFAQLRPGKDGHKFRMLKFRSMVDGADRTVGADEEARRQFEQSDFKLEGDDPRITRLGRFIRRTSLDELPQLINVLRGDMSIVGIRPLLPRQLEQRPVQDQLLFKSMRPGITGLWQVEGRSDIGGDERVALDRRYVEQWCFTSDLKILARTPMAVISSSGAR